MDGMITTCNCALCDKSFAIVGDSDEHIIPNSIGGRRKIRSFICTGCNSRAGETWDAEIWRQFCHIASMHDTERDRGDIPSIPVKTASGKQLKLLPDGSLTPHRVIFEKVPNPQGQGFLISSAVRTMEEAKKMVKSVAAKHLGVNVQEVLSKVQSNLGQFPAEINRSLAPLEDPNIQGCVVAEKAAKSVADVLMSLPGPSVLLPRSNHHDRSSEGSLRMPRN